MWKPDGVDQALMVILKMAKEDCENLTDKMIVPNLLGKRKVGGMGMTLQEVHCKTSIKTIVRCRKEGENGNTK
jgi:hypothetical protein